MKASKAEERRRAARERTFSRLLEGLTLAAAPAAALRFDRFTRCYETSLAGARVIEDGGGSAQVVPVFMTLVHESGRRALVIGASDEESAAWASAKVQFNDDMPSDKRFHAVIDATYQGVRALVDLTAGQARFIGADVPLSLHTFQCDFEAERIVRLGTPDGWEVVYHRLSPEREAIVRASWTDLPRAFAEDLRDLTAMAIECGNDRRAFLAAWSAGLRASDAANHERATRTLAGWMARGTQDNTTDGSV